MRRVLFCLLAGAAVAACTGRPPAAPAPGPLAALPPLPAACGLTTAPSGGSLAAAPVTDAAAVFDTAWTIIRRTHWDTTYNGVDWLAVRDQLRPKAAAARTRGELREVLGDMLARLRQSHFAIIPQEVSDATSAASPSADGAARSGDPGDLGLTTRLIDSLIVVSAVDTGGPAWRAGVRQGWVVERVRDCPMAARIARLPASLEPRRRALMGWQASRNALAGLEGDSVRVRFLDERLSPRELTLTYGEAPGIVSRFGNLPPEAAQLTWHRVRRDGRTVGVIRFNVWLPVLAPRFDAAVDSLRDADAIVLDLRGNLGGVGGMSMGIAGHFLDTAVAFGVMSQRGSTFRFVANPRRVDTRNRAVRPFAGPLAMVVDPMSASTTEVFASGLQSLGRARVFGTQSAGQALPAVPERLPNGDILYHAIANFLGANGKPVEGAGVLPDEVQPLDRRVLAEGRDAALEAAIIWATKQAPRRPQP